MFSAWVICAFLVVVTVLIHYEVLFSISRFLPKLGVRPRYRMIFVVLGCFLAHLIEIWLFGTTMYATGTFTSLGHLEGLHVHEYWAHPFWEYLYFSTVMYTSLGLGDITPGGYLKVISGVEALVGLLMIGWSTSYTYINMERFWEHHRK